MPSAGSQWLEPTHPGQGPPSLDTASGGRAAWLVTKPRGQACRGHTWGQGRASSVQPISWADGGLAWDAGSPEAGGCLSSGTPAHLSPAGEALNPGQAAAHLRSLPPASVLWPVQWEAPTPTPSPDQPGPQWAPRKRGRRPRAWGGPCTLQHCPLLATSRLAPSPRVGGRKHSGGHWTWAQETASCWAGAFWEKGVLCTEALGLQ